MKRFVIQSLILTLVLTSVAAAQQGTRPFTIDDLLKLRRVGDPQLSPDGRTVAFTVTDVDKTANKSKTEIHLLPVSGGAPRQLTNGERSSSAPRWSPDGKTIAFVAAREGGPQIWTVNVASGELKRITNISTGAGDPVWSPDGRMLAFTSEVYPECTNDECNKRRTQEAEEGKVKAKLTDRLLFRHWNAWKEGKRTHVFVASADGGEARDVTPGDYDAPPFSLGGPTDYAFSPDSRELAFARNTERVEATSTNNDIFIVPLAGGEPQRITADNRGSDQSPLYSPDGRYLAYRSQATAGFESARWRLMLYDRQTKKTRELTSKFDAYVEGFTFAPDGKHIYFVSGERGRHPIFMVSTEGDHLMKVLDGFNDDLKISADGKTLVFTRTSATLPTEIFRARLADPMRVEANTVAPVTKTNDAYLAGFSLTPAEELTWEGGGGTKVSGWLVKPANFAAGKKYPLVVLIHGGPQGAWNDAWSYRWNPQIFASAGYMVFMPNPRGSTGFGQQFTDEIS
ncbi:MAG TPA: prolyl oligopeptidase family serine peptidase, partial [Pyrinomonadaceae bacterium]|nr:prolyl oligopeptidase family serine peptidase [Pyrinomonadaceae bacterium]